MCIRDSIYTIDKDSQLKISGLGDHGQLANGSEDNSTSMVPYSEFAKKDVYKRQLLFE